MNRNQKKSIIVILKLRNDRLYNQQNTPYFSQPRMELNIQNNNDHLHIKQEYKNIYEQRPPLVNVPFLEKNIKPIKNTYY